MVKFISYDGKWPCLCMGTLVLEIDGKIVTMPNGCMQSGGHVRAYNDYADWKVTKGEWDVSVPTEYEKYKDEIVRVVNDNVPYGCCGGCI